MAPFAVQNRFNICNANNLITLHSQLQYIWSNSKTPTTQITLFLYIYIYKKVSSSAFEYVYLCMQEEQKLSNVLLLSPTTGEDSGRRST